MSSELHPHLEKVLISSREIQDRVRVLGKQISKDYEGRTPVLVGILRGCVMFLSDLMKHIEVDCSLDFICPSSYGGKTKSSGIVRILLDLRESIEGKDVIIVEDIVDSGLTMNYLLDNLATRRPKSIAVCTLLDKPDSRKVHVPIDYYGFKVPNEFVVGYGLDYREIYRNVPYIGVLKSSKIKD